MEHSPRLSFVSGLEFFCAVRDHLLMSPKKKKLTCQFSSQIVLASELLVPLPDQTPRENLRTFITVQIPPLDPPVNASTPENPLHSQITLENITHIDHETHRAAWAILAPELLLTAERWSVLSIFENQTYYESRDVYNGPVAVAVQLLYEKGLNEAFAAQALALKERAEAA